MTLPWIGEVVYWHWWVLGVLLIVLEILAPGAFFMWMGAAAAVVGTILIIAPEMGWKIQFFLFAVLSVAAIMGWRAWQEKHPIESAEPLLNRRGTQYIGRIFVLEADMTLGRGKIQVDDTTWRAEYEPGKDLPAGSRVRVTEIDGTTLKVEPA